MMKNRKKRRALFSKRVCAEFFMKDKMDIVAIKKLLLFIFFTVFYLTCFLIRRNHFNTAVRQLFREKLINKKLNRDSKNKINYFNPSNFIAPPEIHNKELRQKHIQYSLEMVILLGFIIPVLVVASYQLFDF